MCQNVCLLLSPCKNNVNANNVCTTGGSLAAKIKGTHAEPSSDRPGGNCYPDSHRHLLDTHSHRLKSRMRLCGYIAVKYCEPSQASRHAVIRDTELMGNQSAQVEWPGSWRGEETCLLQMHGLRSAAAFNHQARAYLSLSLFLSFQPAS